MMRFLVTGATGRVGGRAARRLIDEGHQVAAVVRRADAELPAGARPVVADLDDPDTLMVLPEVDGTFLVFPSVQADASAAAVVGALAERSPQIAYLSAAGAQDADPEGWGIMASHARLEKLITESGVRSTLLRASGFAANTLGWAPQIRADGTVRWPYGSARRALIHEDDLAAVGVRELIDHGDGSAEGVVHHLTGPQQLSQREYAAVIGEVIGRPVTYHELSVAEAMAELFGGLPADFARSILTGQAAWVDHPEPVTSTVGTLLGRPARTFAEWVADHRADFGTR
ncbi:NmrA family NAD(P)-binding protein [Microlunatus soli]|uniref:Uncharacterized conserved protein YbjT, contains NAD(P)-binding and DUF2867 domains n=1 Tax=Microlunatus soli TaxID=630515 RepID=A0A1H1ZEM3_9ACTN|nr:NmrA family NAD(P)-binding protein [Microlunatus soli]SDT32069.1 Uncharacterized conserved protein YbjT, contains NAD(P)-binding and DUF2867 domains [Microlunatus soli]